LFDLSCRVSLRKVTKRVLEALIKSGACDCFGASRAGMLTALDMVVARAQKRSDDRKSNQMSLFSVTPARKAAPLTGIGIDCPEAALDEWDDDTRLKAEKEALGFFVSGHPLQPYSREIRRLGLSTLEEAREKFPGAEIACAVEVVDVKKVITKARKEPMAFVGVEDMTGHAEVVFFPAVYDKVKDFLEEGRLLRIAARLQSGGESAQDGDEEEQITARKLKLEGQSARPLDAYCAMSAEPVCVRIPRHRLGREDMLALRNILRNHPGQVETLATVDLDGYECRLSLDRSLKVRPGPELEKDLDLWAS
jgi:DNA polymerase-3 subunit alpha